MGPIELVFLAIVAVFAIVGVIRGYGRELGVTTMLLITLFALEFIDERYRAMFGRVVGIFVGADPVAQSTGRAMVYCVALLVVAFISYEGETLSFPGKRGMILFDLGSGLLNGYLFAGSVWYYLHSANWPILHPTGGFTAFYQLAVRFLPPAIFAWPYLIGLAVILMIARVWK